MMSEQDAFKETVQRVLARKNAEIAKLKSDLCGKDKLIEQLSGVTPNVDWTTKPPTRPGWYWWRDEFHTPQVQHVVLYTYSDLEPPQLFCSFGFIARMGGEWWPERIEEPPIS